MKLYTLDNKFIDNTFTWPDNFTGIIEYHFVSNYGSKEWRIGGKLHRLDGPAIEYRDGTKAWYINGKEFTELEHKLLIDMMKLKGLL